MYPTDIESETQSHTSDSSFLEVSTGRVFKPKITREKLFKGLVFLGVLLFVLILVVVVKQSVETEPLKQCSPGHYNFPDCISK